MDSLFIPKIEIASNQGRNVDQYLNMRNNNRFLMRTVIGSDMQNKEGKEVYENVKSRNSLSHFMSVQEVGRK